jgi:dGTPase
MLEALFDFFLGHPQELGEQARRRAAGIGLHQAVCEYIAGMTDLYAAKEHQRLVGSS